CKPCRKVTQFEVTALLPEAYTKSATINNAQNGFQDTDTWPVNRDVFTDADFVASKNLEESVEDSNTSHRTADEHNQVATSRELNPNQEEEAGSSTSGLSQQD
ncbi:hypothetical protein ILUMI_14080, partial [Ignelater luminosus]